MEPVFSTGDGLTEDVVREISRVKGEPEWMLDFRLKSLEQFNKMPMQEWGPDLSDIDFSKIKYYQNRVTNPHAIGMMYLIKSKKPLKKLGFPKLSVLI